MGHSLEIILEGIKATRAGEDHSAASLLGPANLKPQRLLPRAPPPAWLALEANVTIDIRLGCVGLHVGREIICALNAQLNAVVFVL